jgi:hypothetical protein
MKKQITIICDSETTVPHLLNQTDFEVIATSKDDVWTMIKREVVSGTNDIKVFQDQCIAKDN